MDFKCIGTGSKGNCYIIKSCGISFLLDAGVPITKILENININDVRFAFISHEHKDHSLCKGKLRKRGVPMIDGTELEAWRNWNVDDSFKIHTFPVAHDEDINCNGCIISNDEDCILYITDFTFCKWNLHSYKFTHIIIECNYVEDCITQEMINSIPKIRRQIQTHMGLNGLITFLDSLDLSECKEIILVHKSTDTHLFNDSIALNRIYARYIVPVSICQNNGEIKNIGKDEFKL